MQKARQVPELRVATERFSLIRGKCRGGVNKRHPAAQLGFPQLFLKHKSAPPPQNLSELPGPLLSITWDKRHLQILDIVFKIFPTLTDMVTFKRNPRLKAFSGPATLIGKYQQSQQWKNTHYWMKMFHKTMASGFVAWHTPFQSHTPTPSLASYLCSCKTSLINYRAFPFGQ